jgi:hypothetical protein
MARVVIIGASIGGLPAAYEARALLDKKTYGYGHFQCELVPLRAVESLGCGRLAHSKRH